MITPPVNAGDTIFSLTVESEPATKARPRMGQGRVYTPSVTRRAEETIGLLANAALQGRPPNDIDELAVAIDFYTSTRQRRDIDNMAKVVLDGLNGIVWRDDAQVGALNLTKQVGTPARTEIRVEIRTPRGRPCHTCGKDLDQFQIRGGRVFCSKSCYDRAQQRGHYRRCFGCGKDVYRQKDKARSKVVFCTPECRRTTWGKCRRCKTLVTRKGLRFCGPACRRAWYDETTVGGTHVRGACADCGRATYNRTAKRCRACFLDSRIAA